MSTLGVGTANVFSGRSVDAAGLDGGALVDPERLRAAAALLAERGVDVLAVQEVDRDQPRSGHVDQLAVLAEGFGAVASRFAPTVAGEPGPGTGWQPWPDDGADDGAPLAAGPAYGIGLVSRLPVLAWRVRRLRRSRAVLPVPVPTEGRRPRVLWVPDEPRAALAAVVDAPGGPVTVIATHLSFSPWAALRQLRAVHRWAASLPGPRVLAGDLNLPGRLAARRTGWHPLVTAPTYPVARPRVQLDHLLVDRPPTGLVDGGAVRLPVADHLALTARLTMRDDA
ncbi:endonuclease/exonuclease/phosphatase family protein [Angustibacter peucedani]